MSEPVEIEDALCPKGEAFFLNPEMIQFEQVYGDVWHCPSCGYEADNVSKIWGHIGAKHKKTPKPIRHGSVAGYQAEKRRGLPTCPSCRKAWTAYYRKTRGYSGLSGLRKLLKERKK